VPFARAKRIDTMLSPLTTVRSASPAFLQRIVLGDAPKDGGDEPDATARTTAADLAKILAANMTWYVEWPHVDGRFVAVFQTLPGYHVGGP
jgi:phage terminase large subunit GpA-like protein